MNIKSLLCSALLTGPALLFAQSSTYSITADFPFVSDYVFRGIQYAENSIQPSLEFSTGNFVAGIWTNQPTTTGEDNEFDYFMSYSTPLSNIWTMDVGFTYYDYPETTGAEAQFEPFVGFTAELANGLTTSTTLFYETEYEVTTLATSLGYSVPLTDTINLDLSGEIGGVMTRGSEDYTYWALTSQLNTKLNDKASAYLGVTYSNTDMDHALNPEGDDIFYLTTGIRLGF